MGARVPEEGGGVDERVLDETGVWCLAPALLQRAPGSLRFTEDCAWRLKVVALVVPAAQRQGELHAAG